MKTPQFRAILLLAPTLALALPGSNLAVAQPSEQLAALNSEWAAIPEEDRADLVLLPALSAMDAPPAVAATIVDAALLTPDHPGWSAAEQWATAPAQTAALEALKTVSERRSRFVFAQPYGRAAGNAAIEAGLWTDLGEPELLANAQFGWFGPLDRLGALAHIESTRLAAAGDGVEAMDLMNRWVRFARFFADRLFFAEKTKALSWMIFGVERLRDLAYLYPDSIDDVEMRSVIRELDERELNVGRILLPRADRLASEELLALTFVERGGPNPETFGRTFAQVESRDRPLRLFAEAARWQRLANQHAGYFDTRDRIDAVFNDWNLRWNVSPFDLIWDQPTDYASLDTQRFALIANVVPDVGVLFDQRRTLRTELGGVRLALAVVGYRSWTGAWPDPIFAVRPRFVTEIPIDPWDPGEDEPLRFFVPIRDLPSTERVQPGPHEMEIIGNIADESVSEPAGPVTPDRETIAGWLRSTDSFIPPAAQLNPRSIRMMAQSIPDNMTDTTRSRLRGQLLQAMQASTTPPTAPPDWMRQLAGADADDPRSGNEIIADAMIRVLTGSGYKAGLLALADRPSSTVEDLRDVIVTSILEELGGGGATPRLTSRGDSTYAVPSFMVSLDDSHFIIYSVGPDGEARRALQVGPGGSDILLWPPLISLVREELARN